MRPGLVVVTALSMTFSSAAWAAQDQGEIGLPSQAFALSWTSVPSGHLAPIAPTWAPTRIYDARAMVVDDTRMQRVLDAAFASAADARERREVAMNEMMTPWPQPQRSALQRLRNVEVAYAAGNDQHAERFAALVTRVVDGTGRSAAVDGSASAALDTAYAAALSREDDGARARTEAAQKVFVAYRDAFAAFADGRSPGTGAGVVGRTRPPACQRSCRRATVSRRATVRRARAVGP